MHCIFRVPMLQFRTGSIKRRLCQKMCVKVSVCTLLQPPHKIKIALGISLSEFSLNLVISGKSLLRWWSVSSCAKVMASPKFPHVQTASAQSTIIRNDGVVKLLVQSPCCNITSIFISTYFYYKSTELVGPHAS